MLLAPTLNPLLLPLRDGCVAEEGSHEALMGQGDSVYRAMWEMQAAEEQQQIQRATAAAAMGISEDLSDEEETVVPAIALRARPAV